MTTKESVWLAVYRDELAAQREEHSSLNEECWHMEAVRMANEAADAFGRKFDSVTAGTGSISGPGERG